MWIYRKLRPLVTERDERRSQQFEGLAPLPEPSRESGGLARYKKLAAGTVLVAAAATGGTVIGYWWGHEAAEREAAERPSPERYVPGPSFIPGPPPERAPWPPPGQGGRGWPPSAWEARAAPQPAPNQGAPASKSERQRPDQS